MKRTTRWVWVLVFVVILLSVAVPRLRQMGSAKSVGAAQAGAQPLRVSTFIVEPSAIEDKIVVSGTLLADAQADIQCELTGKIVSIDFQEGAQVAANQVLVRIDDTELRAEKKRLEHEIALAEETEERLGRILQEGIASQDDYDRALKERNTLRARLEVVEAQIQKTIIKAPFDGLIGLKTVSVGSYVSPETRIATIHKIDPIKIDFFVPEKYAGRVHPGSQIRFSRTGRDETLLGEVYAIEPRIDPETRTLHLRAVAPNPDRDILPGAFVEVEVVFEVIESALMIPTQAIIPSMAGQKVFVADDGNASQVAVTTGTRSETLIQVTSGLNPGDEVITSGVLQLVDGMPISPIDPIQEGEAD